MIAHITTVRNGKATTGSCGGASAERWEIRVEGQHVYSTTSEGDHAVVLGELLERIRLAGDESGPFMSLLSRIEKLEGGIWETNGSVARMVARVGALEVGHPKGGGHDFVIPADLCERFDALERRMQPHIDRAHHAHPEEPGQPPVGGFGFKIESAPGFGPTGFGLRIDPTYGCDPPPRPDPRVRAPLKNVTHPQGCVLCGARPTFTAWVGEWEMCHGCIKKLKRALEVG